LTAHTTKKRTTMAKMAAERRVFGNGTGYAGSKDGRKLVPSVSGDATGH
jgi:hypothetical protein